MDLTKERLKLTPPDNLGTKVRVEEVKRFMVECLGTYGVPDTKASQVARVLVAADTRGHYSHGLHHLEMMLDELRHHLIDPRAEPRVEKESAVIAFVNGHNALGAVVATYSMDLAIQKARQEGIGWVVAKGSKHFGMAGYYSMRAQEQGFLGMCFTNTPPCVAAVGGKTGVVGTNPISLAAPGQGDDGFVFDMATTVVSGGKVLIALMKGEGVPKGWIMDSEGAPTENPQQLFQGGSLLPLGGSLLHSSYKGFGLGMMVEILCGILSGGHYGQNIRKMMARDRPVDCSHCFIALDPAFFAQGFKERMSDLLAQCRNSEPVDPECPVVVPGDHSRFHEGQVKQAGFITYHNSQIKASWQLAKYLGVKPMETM